MIGATPIGIGRDAIRERLDAELRDAAPSPTIHPLVRTHVVRLTDSTEQGYQRAVSQLETIAATGIWGAWIGGREWAMEDVRVCAGYCGPPPSDLGTAPLDPAIRAFVDSLDLPGTPAIQDLVSLPELDFLAFTVYYGAPMEVYATVTALRHRGKVGLLRPASWQRAESASNPLIALTDTILRSTALLDTLEQGYVSFYSGTYLPALIRSPIVNRAVMRRVVAHCYDARYFCDLQPVVEVAARNHDIVTLTELGFLSLGGTLYANKALEPRLALRDLANEILPDSSPDPATLFLIALALIDEPDSVLARRLVAHPKARSDMAVLTVLAYRYPGVDSIVLERLPVATRPVLGRLLMASLTYSRHQELRRLLSDPVLGEDRVVLTVVANLGQWVPRVFTAAAARKLPDEVIRRWDDYPVPPVLPER
jgi:hypothetical protein